MRQRPPKKQRIDRRPGLCRSSRKRITHWFPRRLWERCTSRSTRRRATARVLQLKFSVQQQLLRLELRTDRSTLGGAKAGHLMHGKRLLHLPGE